MKNSRWKALLAALASLFAAFTIAGAASSPPLTSISNVPLLLSQPTDPQILLAITNSQSMDGNLSGAIMTGSGTVSSLSGTTSPVDYTVPTGFTAPVTNTAAGNSAPYTVNVNGTLYDNSASRLNVAKAALLESIKQYAKSFDFGLMDYQTTGNSPQLYDTWVYYMSGPNGFSFGDSSSSTPPTGTEWLPNPCYNSSASNCQSIENVLGGEAVSDPFIAVSATSDAPDINDVLYASSGYQAAFLDYGTHTPTNPYQYYGLGAYESGTVTVSYSNCTPGPCIQSTGPTNAGYVPYSPQVLYFERGFGYYTSTQPNTGNLVVPVRPAGINGQPATQSQVNTYVNNFSPYLAPETNNPESKPIKAFSVQSPVAGILEGALNYFESSNPPTSNGCPAKRYVVVVTDGLPTQATNGSDWPPLGSAAASGYGVYATFNLKSGGTISTTSANFATAVANGETTSVDTNSTATNDQALIDTITQLQALAKAGIKTYIVGMGAGVDPSKNPAAAATLKAMAIAGDTKDDFPGVTPQAVVNDLGVIFGQIQAANMSTTAVAVNSTSYQSGSVVYQARFDTEAYGWTGNLVAYPLLSNGTVNTNPADLIWSARNQMQTQYSGTNWNSNRLLVTWNSGTGKGVPFRWADLSAAEQSDLETYWSSLTSAQQAVFSGNVANYGQAVLNYLRGDQSQTQTNGGPFRNRTWLLGDIIHSAPVYVGAPNANYAGTSYTQFAATYANRQPVIYVGSNDGMLHAFSATSGKELFAFFPRAPFANLAALSLPTYNANHQYYVDGSPNAGDVRFADGTWHTIVTGGLNDGGEGVYALDVTNPASWNSEATLASDVLWDITSATPGFQNLGLTYSQPQIAQLDINGTNTFVVIFGSGYNNANGNPYLYVVNAQTGALIRSIDLCSYVGSSYCKNSLPNGLSTPEVISSNGTNVANRVYAGDLQGNLWRIDLSSSDPSQWTATVLFKAQSGSTDQPITTQPVASLAPPAAGGGIMVYFGTGEYLGIPDISNTDTQSVYGVLDRNSTSSLPVTTSELAQMVLNQQTISTSSGSVNVRTVSGSSVNWTSQRGWYINLPLAGERVITNPRLVNGRLIFTTFTPNTATCGAGGTSWLMVLNYANGGELAQPELDINNDGQLNSEDQVNGQNPVGMSLGSGYAAAPTIMGYHQGPFHDIKLITTSAVPVRTVKERGAGPKVLSWIQLR